MENMPLPLHGGVDSPAYCEYTFIARKGFDRINKLMGKMSEPRRNAMRHSRRLVLPETRGSLPIFTVVFALTGFVLPGAQAAPPAPLTSPNPLIWANT